MNLPTSTFDGLATTYQQHRPTYPESVMARLATLARDTSSQTALDVGAGTGIATRALAAVLPAEWRIIALEPSADMLEAARAAGAGDGRVRFEQAGAEELPVNDLSIGLIQVAQALHWFDRPVFYQECARALAPGGRLCVLYNDRKRDDPLTIAFEDRMEAEIEGYDRDYRALAYHAELSDLDWTAEVVIENHDWVWRLTPEDFSGLMLSRSKAKPWVQRDGRAAVDAAYREIAEPFCATDGLVSLNYRTRLLHVQRDEG